VKGYIPVCFAAMSTFLSVRSSTAEVWFDLPSVEMSILVAVLVLIFLYTNLGYNAKTILL